MSYTIPPKPARIGQKRPPPGTDTRREEDHLYDQSSDDAIQDGSLPKKPHSSQSHYANGYQVIAPDPAKNSKLKQMARDEEKAHLRLQQHKRHLMTTHLSTPPKTLGGLILSTEEIDHMRAKQEREAQIEEKYSVIRQKMRREERKKEERRRETEKIEEHKRKQREKGERLERKKAVEEPIRQDEIRRARLVYFDKHQ